MRINPVIAFTTAAISIAALSGCDGKNNSQKPSNTDQTQQAQAGERQEIALQSYCEEFQRIAGADPDQFARFIQSNTPFERSETVTVTFNSSVHGQLEITVPAETFVVIPNPQETEWGANRDDIGLLETGGAIASIHSSLGYLNESDPEDIRRLAEIAVQDISISSKYITPLLRHLDEKHGIILKVADPNNPGQYIDSPQFEALKAQAMEFIIE